MPNPPLNNERFDEALSILGLHSSNVSRYEVDEAYLNVMEIITINKNKESDSISEDRI